MVELSVYNDIPSPFLIPVVTNPRKASKALQRLWMKWKIVMNSRRRGSSNIAGFNAKVEEFNAQSEYSEVPYRSRRDCG